MPAFHVAGVSPKIRAGLIELVVEFQIQVMGLKIRNQKDGRHCSGELSKSIDDVLSLQSYALSKFLIVHPGG